MSCNITKEWSWHQWLREQLRLVASYYRPSLAASRAEMAFCLAGLKRPPGATIHATTDASSL